jgi:glycosyltransferase involved in cell wall biosynthesis
MEAMACGLPVIATRWGGNLDFMTDDNSWLLDIDGLVQIDAREEFSFYRGQNWAEPSVEHLKRLMRLSAASSELRQLLGKRARKDMEERWDWGTIAPLAGLRLKEILHGVPAEQSRLNGNVCDSFIGSQDRLPGRKEAPSAPVPTGDRFRICWEGSQLVSHSLALVNRELCLALSETGHELALIPYEPDQLDVEADPRFRKIADLTGAPLSGPCDVHVRHQWPPCFTPPQEGHWVMIQPWEYGRVPKEWVAPMSTLVDEIWVPSRHVFRSFVSSGIPSDRVRVIPNGVNTSLFSPDAKPYPLATTRKFKFLFVGGTIWRKGVDILLQAYRDAFSRNDDVVLVIKDLGQNSFYRGQGAGEAIRAIQSDPDAPAILYMTDMLAESDMPGLFTASDCLVHPYRGEGFGLPVLEAMACGVPVIVTAGGATDDFCTDEIGCRVLSQRKGFVSQDIDFVGGSGWVLEPDVRALGHSMRHVFEHLGEARDKAAKALAHVRTDYTWEKVGTQVLDRIRSIRLRPIRRVHTSYLKAV